MPFKNANVAANTDLTATIHEMCRTAAQRKDAHVVATAVSTEASVIVTTNIEDYGSNFLDAYNLHILPSGNGANFIFRKLRYTSRSRVKFPLRILINLNYSKAKTSLPPAIHDPARLQALADHEILDTPATREFDDIAMIASVLCGTPVALVSLVAADRQWFKARVGFEACETPIDQSVCAHTLGQHETLVIPDLTNDDRTKANRLVTQAPFIRFYAGAPLIMPSGQVLGSLCVIDTMPSLHGLTEAQKNTLEALARQVVNLIELERLVRERGEAVVKANQSSRTLLTQARFSDAQRTVSGQAVLRTLTAQSACGIGTFDVDLATDIIRCSPELCRIYGVAERASFETNELEAFTVAEDKSSGSTSLTRAAGTAPTVVELRIRRADDGKVRWIRRKGEFIYDESGQPRMFTGTVADITERKQSELRQAGLVRLGDELRDVRTSLEAQTVAACVLGSVLDGSRAGYASVDNNAGLFRVERDWTRGALNSTPVNIRSTSLLRPSLDSRMAPRSRSMI